LSPKTGVNARKHGRRSQAAQNEHESDRLDRLRNPSKYLGR
jgi:hypothetical protein